MEYSVKLYKNTGFNSKNIPDSPSVLEASAVETIVNQNAIKRQNCFISSIRIPYQVESVKNVDYILIGDEYYSVTSVRMGSENTAVLDLYPDPLTTMGGPANIAWDGWATRYHSKTDELFENNLPEPFAQLEPWEFSTEHRTIGAVSDEYNYLIGSAVAITDSGRGITNTKESITFKDADTESDLSVTIPAAKSIRKETEFRLAPSISEQFRHPLEYPQICFYDGKNVDVREGAELIRGIGAETSIIYSYSIPAGYATTTPFEGLMGIPNGFAKVEGVLVQQDTAIPFEYTEVKNKKCFSGQFVRVMLICPSSGNTKEYNPEDIYTEGYTTPQFVYFSDPSPEGRPYFRPLDYKGNRDNYFMAALAGSNWQNTPIAFDNYSGQRVDMTNMLLNNADTLNRLNMKQTYETAAFERGVPYNTMSSLVSGISSILGDREGGSISALGSVGGNLVNTIRTAEDLKIRHEYERQLTQNTLTLQGNHQVIRQSTRPIDVAFPFSAGIQNYAGNVAYVYQMHISGKDLQRLDDFFSAYGYAGNEKLTGEMFTGRVNHNYVQATARCIDSRFPMSYREAAAEALAGGVRVWHTKPTVEKLYNNPIAG